MSATPVLQFGTSRFLQAHADLFFSEGTPALGVTVVQSSGDPARAKRLAALADPAGFPVRVRGIWRGQRIDEERRVTSVKRTLSTAMDWAAVEEAAAAATVILSNTGDAGYQPQAADFAARPDQAMSFPAKLCHLLRARHAAGLAPPLVMPLELVPDNGSVLKDHVRAAALKQQADRGFLDWLKATPFATSLVDRIVSEPIEPAGAVAEPYALWAIQRQAGVFAPCAHEAIQTVAALETIERLKLHILNLGHTVLAQLWRERGAPEAALVRQSMEGPDGETLDALWRDEVLPGFAARGLEVEARAYMATTRERFENPFLDHRLADIAANHSIKAQRRIGAFVDWVSDAQTVPMPRLRALLVRANA